MLTNDQCVQYPTIRKRLGSFILTYFFPLSLFIYSLPFLAVSVLLNMLGISDKTNQVISITFEVIFLLYFMWCAASFGMTIRHFLYGYAVRNSKDGSVPNVLKLYIREITAAVFGFAFLIRRGVPVLLNRAINYHENEQHLVVATRDKIYVSNQSIGTMKMNQEMNESFAEGFQKIAQDGFGHDKLMGTYTVNQSRYEVIQSLLTSGRVNLSVKNAKDTTLPKVS